MECGIVTNFKHKFGNTFYSHYFLTNHKTLESLWKIQFLHQINWIKANPIISKHIWHLDQKCREICYPKLYEKIMKQKQFGELFVIKWFVWEIHVPLAEEKKSNIKKNKSEPIYFSPYSYNSYSIITLHILILITAYCFMILYKMWITEFRTLI